MKLRLFLLVPCLSLFGCASMPSPPAPQAIQPPPAALLGTCPKPEPLPDMATANELAAFAAQALKLAACEHARSIGLLESWPQ